MMSSSPSRIVTEFLGAFMSGDIEKASRMVRNDFSFQAPLLDGRGDKAAYFAGAADKARFIRAFRILRQWADGNEVSTLYELDIQTAEGMATLPVSEWQAVEDGQVVSTFMVFNGAARAVQLLRNALGAHR